MEVIKKAKIKENLLAELTRLDKATKQVSIEYLRLLVEAEKRHRVALKLEPFECSVIAFDKLEIFLNDYLRSSFSINKRVQLIIKYEEHYSTIDIAREKNKKRCLLLDAANDKRMLGVYKVLKNFAFDRLFVVSGKRDVSGRGQNLQRDCHSCSMFAFDHAIQLSKKDIYSDLEKLVKEEHHRNEGYTTLYWDQLLIPLVWNAQSLSFLSAYLDKNINKLTQNQIETYKKYIKKNTKADVNGKSRNMAVDHIFELRLKQILPWVKKLSQTDIDSIIGDDAYLTFMHKKGAAFTSSSNSAFFQACKLEDASANANDRSFLVRRSA